MKQWKYRTSDGKFRVAPVNTSWVNAKLVALKCCEELLKEGHDHKFWPKDLVLLSPRGEQTHHRMDFEWTFKFYEEV